jgi:undecaprenyl-diphosphatase
VILATVLTAIVGEIIIKIIERTIFAGVSHAEIEDLFSHLEIIAPALAAAGVLILIAGLKRRAPGATAGPTDITLNQASLIGAVQGLCLPFRGFSRSGATISAGMLSGVEKARAESFSFALAVVLTPAVVARELLRLMHAQRIQGMPALADAIFPSVIGAVCAFIAGLVALRWLSRWLERGRWYVFGIYCLIAAAVVATLHHAGY